MKKNPKLGGWDYCILSKTFRIMRILFFFMFVGISHIFAESSYAQVKRLTIELENVKAEKVLDEIENQSRFYFLYNEKLVDVDFLTSVKFKDENIFAVLDHLFAGRDIVYKVVDNQIILSNGKNSLGNVQQTEINIRGRVTNEEGEPIPGATVAVKGTTIGTITDMDGNYSLTIPADAEVLVFSFVGMKTVEVTIGDQTQIDVALSEDMVGLDEVLVVGYSVQKKSTLTGAVSPVSVGDMEKRRVAELGQALQGQVAGVQVTQSTGAPGDEINIRIRGEGTIGSNDPLYIVDGVPTRELSFLNPADIESMTVLKDASAAAIYGSRASAGVIIITTKNGAAGKSEFDINYYRGVQFAANLPDLLNAEQYLDVLEKAWDNSGYSGTNPYSADKGRSDFADTDWLDELFETGFSQNVQMTASGGNEKLQYLLSAGYFDQDGIVVYDNDKYQRYNFRANINNNLTDRIKIGTNMQLSYAIQDKLSSSGDTPGIIRHALLRPPIISVYKSEDDPTYSEDDPFTDLPFYKEDGTFESDKYEWTQNPIALAYFTDDKRSQFKTFGNLYGEFDFLADKSLKFRTNVGIDLNFYHNKAFYENFGDDDGNGSSIDEGLGRQNRPDGLSESRSEAFTLTWNNTLNYQKNIGQHSVNALIGSEFITNYESDISASRWRYDYDSDEFRYIDYGSTEQDLWNSGTASEWALMSYFASGTYVYDMKYMVTANLRADASSRFSEDNQWGFFPSVSFGWKLSEEPFMDKFDWLSDLKLRASIGQLGNQEIDNYAYLTLIEKEGDKYLISRYGNSDLKWETTTQYNYGLDLGLFKNKVYLIVDYFNKNTSDILLPISLPSIVGDVEPTIVNAGEVSNKGWEFGLTYRNREHEFKYSINANLSTNKNKVEKLHPNLPSIVDGVTRTEAGHPLNSYYGYVFEGIYQNEEEIAEHLFGTSNPTVVPGDIRFKDLNGDGKIDDNDRDFIGDPNPGLLYGLSFSGSYKGFDFSLLFQGVGDVDRYNESKKTVDYDTRPFNYTTNVLNAWDGEGSTNSIPRVSFTDNGGSKVSSIYVEDASYFRLKNIEIGYSFPGIKQIGLKNMRFYISAQNDYTGLDPESTDLMDMGTYPQARLFIGGVNLVF
ncbi:TonB-dependent receptor [Thermophagus xiamenensis]|uniref:TonB-dependent receptor n=1 Tax=Thermophagus xiamenensis TaxID=385682 RepID=UPI000255CDEC|nr:TonB-dependent receptor [Thermophagus xiamenensis]